MVLTRRSFLGKSALTVLSLSLPSVASAESDPIMSILERYVRFQEPEWNSRNLDLQTKLDEFFQSYWLKGSVNDGEVQSYLLFDANKNRTMAALNDNLQMWAASTVKVYHNLLFFDALSKGQASYNISDKKDWEIYFMQIGKEVITQLMKF